MFCLDVSFKTNADVSTGKLYTEKTANILVFGVSGELQIRQERSCLLTSSQSFAQREGVAVVQSQDCSADTAAPTMASCLVPRLMLLSASAVNRSEELVCLKHNKKGD